VILNKERGGWDKYKGYGETTNKGSVFMEDIETLFWNTVVMN